MSEQLSGITDSEADSILQENGIDADAAYNRLRERVKRERGEELPPLPATNWLVCSWMPTAGPRTYRARGVRANGLGGSWCPWDHVCWLGPEYLRDDEAEAERAAVADGQASGLPRW